MTPAAHPVALIPPLRTAVDQFLGRSRFAARTREGYARDLAPLLAHLGDRPVSALTHTVAAAFLSAHEHLAASTFNRRYAALRSFVRITARKARNPRHADLTAEGHARLSYRQVDTLGKGYTPGWDLHQLRHTAITARAAKGYTEVELKRFSGHTSLRSLEVYIAYNRESAKYKAREWERRGQADL